MHNVYAFVGYHRKQSHLPDDWLPPKCSGDLCALLELWLTVVGYGAPTTRFEIHFLLLTHEFSSPFIVIAPLSKRNPACERCGCLRLKSSRVSWQRCFLIGWSASLSIKISFVCLFLMNSGTFCEMKEINYSECCVRVTTESNSSDNKKYKEKTSPG